MKLLSMFIFDSRIARPSGTRLRAVYECACRVRLANSVLTVIAFAAIVLPVIAPAANVCAQDAGAGAAVHQDEAMFQAAVRQTEPLTVAEQQASFSLADGFKISCFASEPDLQKPMNMAFDNDGRLWVTGSNEYPIPAKPGMGSDSVRILEDTDADGVADSVTVFADNLNIPIGLLPYKGGAIVFTIPDIVYLEDTTGDGKADRQTKLFGPFDTSRDTHGMTNSFTTYHDGWVYACHGFNNQTTVAGTDGHAVTMHSGNTYRFRPDGSRIEIFSSGQVNPFGMTCDDVGDLFTSDCHSKPVNLLMRGGYHESFGKPNDGLGFIPNVMEHQHGSTAIDAACWIDCPKFPKATQGSLLLGNVMTGRIHRNRIVRTGATIRMQQEDDFVVSSDPWFRPVDIQAGPDSAIYVADFYNRVIGHYEVPLDHEGRDRYRGRIWKISYVGEEATSEQLQAGNVRLSDASLEELLQNLNDPALQIRMRAAELLVNHPDAAGEVRIREAWQSAADQESVAASHLLWILHRTNKLQPADLQTALNSMDRVLKIHAMKVCSAQSASDFVTEQIKRGLRDSDRLVARAAADAAAMHPSIVAFKELVNVLTVSPTDDLHLRHQAKIALRDQLQNDDVVDWFLQATQPEAAYQACRQVIRGLHTKQAALIVLSILKNTKQSSEEVAALIGHAAEFADNESVNELVSYAAQIKDVDSDQLIRIHSVLAESLGRNSTADQTAFRAFEADLLDQLVADVQVDDLRWGRYQWDDRAAGAWGTEERQRSDSTVGRFLSSLPGGESGVSVLRSKSFVVPFQLKFEICGHSGSPKQPPSLNNQLVLRETKTGSVVQSERPPRNDMAVSVTWKLVSAVGRRAVLELHDGMDQNSYAWLALGPMSPAVASPPLGQQSAQQEQLLTIVRILHAASQNGILQDDHLKLLADTVLADQVNGQTRQEAAAVLFQQRKLPEMSGLSVLLKYGRVSLPVQNYVGDACAVSEPWMGVVQQVDLASEPTAGKLMFEELPQPPLQPETDKSGEAASKIPLMERADWVRKTVQAVFGELPEFYRTKLALEMASTPGGAALLVEVMKTGTPSVVLLHDEDLVSLLKAQGATIALDVQQMMKDLPQEESVPAAYVTTVLNRLKSETTATDLESGKVLFERHCVVCHRRNSKGGQAGPQLDGIKTRGSERLLEDILYPHRNVDVAFRTSVVILKSGKTTTGLYRPQQNGRTAAIVKADGTVQEVSVEDIDQQTETLRSLMPPGFHKLMSEREMASLLSWLNQ